MLAVLLLIGVLLFGRRVNGALRWFVFGPIRFQPSEFAKYALVIFLAFWLERMQRVPKGHHRPRIRHWWWGVFGPLLITGGVAALILKEPDMGAAMLLVMVALALLWVAGAPAGWLAAIVGTAGTAIGGALVAIFRYGMFREYYQVQRLVHWVFQDDLQGTNYQQHMATLAFTYGGPWGAGLGNSRMKLGHLPEAHTDFILPIIGEELGVVATLAIIVAFCVLVICGLLLAARSPDMFGQLLACGVTTVIGIQALINISVVTNSLPNKGMALPFISYGGSNLLMTLGAAGIVFSVYRRAYAHAVGATASEVAGE